MSIEFKNVSKIIGPSGKEVTKITRTSDSVILWQNGGTQLITKDGQYANSFQLKTGSNSYVQVYRHQKVGNNYYLKLSTFGTGQQGYYDFYFNDMSAVSLPLNGKKIKFGYCWFLNSQYTVNKITWYALKQDGSQGNQFTTWTVGTTKTDWSNEELTLPNDCYGVRMQIAMSRNQNTKWDFARIQDVQLI